MESYDMECIYCNSTDGASLCKGADPYPDFRECECKNCYLYEKYKEKE